MPPKKKEDMSKEEREKMLVRLADMRQKVADNRKAKAESNGGIEPSTKPNAEIFTNTPKIEIKKPVAKKHEDEVLAKLDKVANHLEKLTAYKEEKIKAKKEKEQETKIKEEIKPPAPNPVPIVTAPKVEEFQFPRSYGNRFFQGGRF